MLFKTAQVKQGGRKGKGEFLRLGPASGMDNTPIGFDNRCHETARAQIDHGSRKTLGDLLAIPGCLACDCKGPERVETKTDFGVDWQHITGLDHLGHGLNGCFAMGTWIENQIGPDIKQHMLKYGINRLDGGRQAEAIGVNGPLEHQR